MAQDIEALDRIISRFKDSTEPRQIAIREKAIQSRAELKGETPKEKTPPAESGGECPEAITEALASIESALALMGKGGGDVDEEQVKALISKAKINLFQLGDDVLEEIGKTQQIEIITDLGTITKVGGQVPELFWKICSDLQVHNNVYLYGGAGTGKTYISKEVAKALNATPIVINCNQYTSPLELIGGQTITGYQQGSLITAWANLIQKEADGVMGGMDEGNDACLLILDELPKLDPNTAGILNDALALVKDKGKKSEIKDGRGKVHEKMNFYCIATGNVRLNEESTAYSANFKQDLSLQDRFAGSTYLVFVDKEMERRLMAGYDFIWLYMSKVRAIIVSPEGMRMNMEEKAFVSIRIMQSLRDTWIFWYKNHKAQPKIKSVTEGVRSFFNLFTEGQAEHLEKESDFDGFKKLVDTMATKELTYTTPEEKVAGDAVITQWKKETKNML